MKSWKRSEGPAFGPTGSYCVFSAGPAGPVCPEWLKYGPIDRITGVLSAFVEPFGRRMSACRVASPASDGDEMNASVQSASGYATPAAVAAAGNEAAAAAATTSTNQDRPNMRCPPPRKSLSKRALTLDRSNAGGRSCAHVAHLTRQALGTSDAGLPDRGGRDRKPPARWSGSGTRGP